MASFEPLPKGARAAGMGEAYSAIADDVYSLYYNPAGVLQIARPEIGSYYSRLFMGLSDNSSINHTFLGYAQPLGKNGHNGGIGVSYSALELQGLYKEEAYGMTYGREFRHTLNVGGTLRILRKQIGSDDYTANAINPVTGNATGSPDPLLAKGSSKSGYGLDLGVQYRLSRTYAVGAALRNLNSPDLALSGGSDKVPAVTSLAIARRLRTGSLNAEFTNWKSAASNTRLSLGGENWFKNGFGFRAGGGFGSNNYSTLSMGASYRMESFQLDYAFIFPLQGVQGTLGTQQVSLTVRFGKAPVDPLEQQLMQEKEERIRAETEARYAKAERDRLKAQLYALTEEKTKIDREQEENAARKALEEVQQQKAREERNAARSQDRNLLNDYTEALTDYNTKVRSGISMAEKRSMLEKILARFKDSGIDTSIVNRELKSLIVEESRAKKDFEQSMSFYQRLVQQGASVDDRRGMLNRIIQKYKGTGVDIRQAEDEMKALK
jgi:hypothetical protein